MTCCCNTGRDGNKKKDKVVVWVVLGIVLALGILFYYTRSGDQAAARSTFGEAQAAVTPVVTDKEIVFPENAFADGKAQHFKHKTPDGKTIRYFIVKSSDGVIRAAFDACDVCYPADKGYYQKDDFMICRNCGRRFQSVKVNVVTGGCNPAALTRSVRDGKVAIPTQALLQGKHYFK